MLLSVQYAHDVTFAVLAYMPGPGNELLATPFADEPMMREHMTGHSGIAVLLPLPGMCRQAFVLVVYLHEAVGVDDLDLFADMLVRNAVIMLVLSQIDMAVLVYRALGVGSYLVARGAMA